MLNIPICSMYVPRHAGTEKLSAKQQTANSACLVLPKDPGQLAFSFLRLPFTLSSPSPSRRQATSQRRTPQIGREATTWSLHSPCVCLCNPTHAMRSAATTPKHSTHTHIQPTSTTTKDTLNLMPIRREGADALPDRQQAATPPPIPSAPSRKTYLAPPPPLPRTSTGLGLCRGCRGKLPNQGSECVWVSVSRLPGPRSPASKPSASLPASQPATPCCVTGDPSLTSAAVCTAVGCHKNCRDY